MCSELAIKVSDLSKCFHVYEKPRDRLLQMLLRGRRKYYKEFWANRNISLEVTRGETVGIVGRNGSGKSTLLQMICGTLNPTGGEIQVQGRIAALLELGSGFNPEFSGRENVYLNAAVLGLDRAETDRRFDSILKFSEIGNFIDQPVKTYSSGMLVRLAFAVAINVDPKILVVDEALSVGDELFQRKCFSRIEEIKKGGATILFVSHSGSAIIELCDRAVLIDAGEKLADGPPKEIIGAYQRLLYAPAEQREEIRNDILSGRVNSLIMPNSGSTEPVEKSANIEVGEEFLDPSLLPTSTINYASNGAAIEEAWIETLGGQRVNNLCQGRRYTYCYRVAFARSATRVRFGMLIKTTSGTEVGGAHTARLAHQGVEYIAGGEQYLVRFEFDCLVNPGIYFLNAGVTGSLDTEDIHLHRVLDIHMFRVLPNPDNLGTAIVNFNCSPRIECIK